MKEFIIILVAVSLLFSASWAKFAVVAPAQLKTDLGEPITFSIAHYGNAPYGSTQLGTLVLANPIDGCSPLDKLPVEDDDPNTIYFPIVIMKRGNCKFSIKTRYAQMIGAKSVVFVNDRDDEVKNVFGPSFEPDIVIPSILISKEYGNIIVKFLNGTSEDRKNVQVSIQYPFGPYAQSKIDIEFWFSSADSISKSYSFLSEIRSKIESASESFTFTPHYVTTPCQKCKKKSFTSAEKGCISSGRYCAPDPDGDGPLTGADVVLEDLKQICIFKLEPDIWWDYVEEFPKACHNVPDEGKCGDGILAKVNADKETIASIETCVKTSFFKGGEIDPSIDNNKYLAEERANQVDRELSSFPAVLINGRQYNGKLNAQEVFKAACDSFISPPYECQEHVIIPQPDRINYSFIFMVGGILLILMIIVLYLYRRMARREMNKEMSIQISAMVSQYFTLGEETTGFKRKDNL